MICSDPTCDKPARCRGMCNAHYKRWYYGPDGPGDPETRKHRDLDKRRASWRAKNHRRRTEGRVTDVTAKRDRELRAKAKRCPMPGCGVRLTDEPYLPNSKELDHIVPVNPVVGGTTTDGNVRIICRACNLKRPKDGSDYYGPVVLWAYEPGFVPPPAHRQRGMCDQCGAKKVKSRCLACRPLATRAHADVRVLAARAAELRAQGWKWKAIATETGFAVSSVATYARKWGDPDVVARWHVEDVCCRDCAVVLPPQQGKGRPRRYCSECRPPVGVIRRVTLLRAIEFDSMSHSA